MTKYNARKTEVDGITFASKRESERYTELKLLERAGLITDLELQPSFELQPAFMYDGKKEMAIVYKADFQYFDVETNTIITEDVKGVRTEIYKLKRKMLLRNFPYVIFREV